MRDPLIDPVLEKAEEAFWAVVADAFPSATSGDLDIGLVAHFNAVCRSAIKVWVETNVPAGDLAPESPAETFVAPGTPPELIDLAEKAYAELFPWKNSAPDVSRALAFIHANANGEGLETRILHSGGGFEHACGFFEFGGTRYFMFTYYEGVEVHRTTDSYVGDAWHATTHEDLNAVSKVISLTS